MGDWATVVIPTRDSAAWIGVLLAHYRARGVRPMVFLDSRSVDATGEIVRAAGVPIVDLAPFAFTEAIVSVTRDAVETPFAFLVNDDEIPSAALFARLAGPPPAAGVQSVAVPRRWAWHEPGKPLHYGRSSHWGDRAGGSGGDHHWRIFRPREVTFIAKMHTDGYLIETWARMPPEAYLVHFEWVLRSAAQRAAKLRRYDRHRFGYGKFFENMYLPERQPAGVIEYLPFETTDYDTLASVHFQARKGGQGREEWPLKTWWQAARHKLWPKPLEDEPADRVGLKPRLELEVPL